jgi:pyruvate carboxylase
VKGETPVTVRPASLPPDTDLVERRAEAEGALDREIDERELSACLMYPKVFTEFAAVQRKYGPVSKLPTPVLFYGRGVGDETTFEIEPGKTLVVQLTAIGQPREDGQVEVFFELNGQPRTIVVPDRIASSTIKQRRKAESDNAGHIAAPMPGVVSMIGVANEQSVKAGDVLLVFEAMKMETVLHAPSDGKIAEILVTPGQHIDTKDLLMVLD